LAALAWLGAASGCAGGPGARGEDQVPRPEWRVGDRWMFRRILLSGATEIVTHQVTEAGAEGYTVRIFGGGREVTRYWTIDLHLRRQVAGGSQVSHFEPAAMYFAWPIALGKTWTQEFEYRDGQRDGRYANVWRVGPTVESIDSLAGPIYAVRIEHRGAQGERLATYWYAPRIRYWVRLENYQAGYTEELIEFRPS